MIKIQKLNIFKVVLSDFVILKQFYKMNKIIFYIMLK